MGLEMIVSAKHTSLLFPSAIFFMYPLTRGWIQTLDLMINSGVFYHCATAVGEQTSLQSWMLIALQKLS